jgi:integrase
MTKRRSHGDGSITQRGENSFRLRYRIGKQRCSATFKGTLAEAKVELRRLLRAIDTREHVAPDRGTLADWARCWLDSGAPGQKRQAVGDVTLEKYDRLLRVHVLPALGALKLQELDGTHIDKLYRSLQCAPRTARQIHSTLNACLASAVRVRRLAVNPMQTVATIPGGGESDHGIALDDDQLRTLVRGFKGSALFPIVSVAAFTGMRRNEVLALRWSDLDVQNKTLRVERSIESTLKHGLRFKGPKTERSKRTIIIDDGLIALLLSVKDRHLRLKAGVPDNAAVDLSLIRLPENALMFPSPPALADGDFEAPRHGVTISRDFACAAARLGFPGLRFHDLRGTHGTLLLDRGVPVHTVAARLGHGPATLLRSYAKRTRKADSSVASIIGSISKSILG